MKHLLIFLVFGFAVSGFSQTFDPTWTKIPTTFKGNDAKAIVHTLLLSPERKEKGEFETTEEYQRRIAGMAKMSLGNGATLDQQFVFRYAVATALDRVESQYDADRGILTVSCMITYHQVYRRVNGRPSELRLTGIPVAETEYKDLGTYIGSNAMGAKVTVTKTDVTRYQIAFSDLSAFDPNLSNDANSWSTEIKLDIPAAKEAKAHLGLLYVANLVSPYFDLAFLDIEPKIDSPQEIKSRTYILIADISAIWVFNTQTGEVYRKVKAGETPARPKIFI